MLRFVLTRVASAVPTLLVIITLAFALIHAAPGGPFDEEQAMPAPIRANLDAAYGLDQPLGVQYIRYLRGILHFDFGPSFKYRDFSVSDLIAQGLPVSATVGALALGLALLFGVLAGSAAAVRPGTWLDRAVMGISVAGLAVPTFVLLPLLTLVFGVRLHWLPVAGWDPGAVRFLILPVIALALPPLAVISRLTRSSMLEVLDQPFIRTARAKGLPAALIIWRHALPPALIPVTGYLAPATAAILTGSLVVESIAGLPGVGRYLVQGALNRDYTLVLGMVIVYSSLLIGAGLIFDVLHAVLDPRVRVP